MQDEIIPNLHRKKTNRKAWVKRFLQHGPHCHYCNCDLTLDTAVKEHLTPLCRGGLDVIANIVPACATCNVMKAFRTEAEFIRDRPMLLARRTAVRAKAFPTREVLAMEEANEPGLLKKIMYEREHNGRSWWRSA